MGLDALALGACSVPDFRRYFDVDSLAKRKSGKGGKRKMPLINIFGLSVWSPSVIKKDLRDACFNVKELELASRQDITIYPIASDSVFTDSDPLIIIVELLSDKPARTPEVRQKLAEALGKAAKTSFPNRPVEVAIKRFNTDKDVFWTG